MVFLGDKSPEGTMAKFPAGATSSEAPAQPAALAATVNPAAAGRGQRVCSLLQDHGNIWGQGGQPGSVLSLSPPAAAKQRPSQPIQLLQLLG